MKAGIERRLAQAEAKVARLERMVGDGGPGAEVATSFHLGTVGGSGRNVRRLNARKAAHLDRVIDAAVALPAARTAVARLRLRMERSEVPKPARPKAAPRRPRAIVAPEQAERMRTIARWYLYGGADEEPPFPGLTRKEIDAAVRYRTRMANQQEPG